MGVILSGSGYLDGSEIHEATLTLYFLDKLKIKTECFAPNKPQKDSINHSTQQTEKNTKNVLEESARIARGEIKALTHANPNDLDGLILPGGYGAAKNLSDFANNGASCTVDPDLSNLIKTCHQQKKPIGFICISPAIAAKLIPQAKLTIGTDQETASILEQIGATHKNCTVNEMCIDEKTTSSVHPPTCQKMQALPKSQQVLKNLLIML